MITQILDDGFVRPLREITDPKEVIQINDLKLGINKLSKKVKWGRYALYYLTGAYLLAGFVHPAPDVEPYEVWIEVGILSSLTAASAAVTFRRPGAGLIAGLLIYVLYQFLLAILSPELVFRGLVGKVAVLYVLAQAIFSWYEHRRELGRLEEYPVPREEIVTARRLEAIPPTLRVKTPGI